jgi:hypothetical protein
MFIFLLSSIKDFLTNQINFQMLLITFLFFIIGFIYFYNNLRNYENSINNFDNNNNINNNIPNNNNNNNDNNINNNNNNNDLIHIEIQIETNRHNFTIHKNDFISGFINTKIKPLVNNREVYLFYQGQLLDQNKQFNFYAHRLIENSVIICKVRQNINNNNFNQNHYSDSNYEQNEYENDDPKSVSIYSIFTHIVIFIFFVMFVFFYKNMNELITPVTKNYIQICSIIWAVFLSQTISKVIIYKKIVY